MDLIVAVDRNWAIGRGKDLLVSIPEDQKRFRQMTLGHTVVYGRKTMDSFPGAKALPKRRNIVLSRHLNAGVQYEVCRSYKELAGLLSTAQEPIHLIGGATLYRDLLPFCSHAHITRIDQLYPEADSFMPNLEEIRIWELTDETEPIYDDKHKLYFTYRTYENLMPRSILSLTDLD